MEILRVSSGKCVFKISVTELARSMGRCGDLGRRTFSLLRGVEGIQVHQRMQKNRGETYQAEVPVSGLWEFEGEGVEIFGRMDGVENTSEGPVIEELKTSRDFEDQLPLDHSVHVLQTELYAWLWMREKGSPPRLRLEYVHPDPQLPTRRLEWQPDAAELSQKIETVLREWLSLRLAQAQWVAARNRRLADLEFPYAELRPGQQELMDQVAQVQEDECRLYVQAPTGIGKTLGVLLPALRKMGEGRFEKLLIATCRNTGKRIFEEAQRQLFPEGPGLRMLTLVARERVCRETGSPCDGEQCPLAKGFYDRLPEGMAALRQESRWDAESWQRVAASHQLCPFGLMMHAAREADVLLGDLNYALDPSSRLEFLFGEGAAPLSLIIDEAHHVPDRCRGMISAELDPIALQKIFRQLPAEMQSLLRTSFRGISREIRDYEKQFLDQEGWPQEGAPSPERLGFICGKLLEKIEQLLAENAAEAGDPLLELYRALAEFRQSMDHRQPSHVCTMEKGVFRHLCLDVSGWLRQRLAFPRSTVMFSGTLLPLEEFMRQTGALKKDRQLELASPFNPARFRIDLEDELPLVWKARGPELYERLARRIVDELTARSAKTLVFFPSYALMEEVASRMPKNDLWLGPVYVQPRGMQEEGSDTFLRPFRESGGPVCGLAVLGGALNEGIDLPGTMLESVIVVSIGLPGISRERELMRRWVDAQGGEGFLTAYTYPGLVRVLQAIGRVIRGPEDRGTALLIDPRFRHPLYEKYIPFR